MQEGVTSAVGWMDGSAYHKLICKCVLAGKGLAGGARSMKGIQLFCLLQGNDILSTLAWVVHSYLYTLYIYACEYGWIGGTEGEWGGRTPLHLSCVCVCVCVCCNSSMPSRPPCGCFPLYKYITNLSISRPEP